MNEYFKKILLVSTIFFIFNILFLAPVYAVPGLDGLLIPSYCTDSDNKTPCGVDQFAEVLVNFFQLMLGVLGSLSLAFFIYGGFIWLLSRGNQQMIQKGKDIIIGAIIGMSIALGSWIIVNFVIALLTGAEFTDVKLFKKDWWKF